MSTPYERQTQPPAGTPYGFIQWKGTDVCMDFHCECGLVGHIDDSFAYNVRCPKCGTVYMCNPHIELVKLTPSEAEEAGSIVNVPMDSGIVDEVEEPDEQPSPDGDNQFRAWTQIPSGLFIPQK